jgi:head-tail adaptor
LCFVKPTVTKFVGVFVRFRYAITAHTRTHTLQGIFTIVFPVDDAGALLRGSIFLVRVLRLVT